MSDAKTPEEDAFLRGWDGGYRLAEQRASQPPSGDAPEYICGQCGQPFSRHVEEAGFSVCPNPPALREAVEYAIGFITRVQEYAFVNRADYRVPGPMEKEAGVLLAMLRARLDPSPPSGDAPDLREALDRLDAWAGCVHRLIAVAPISAVVGETGMRPPGHSTPPERKAIREAAALVVASWLERDRAALAASAPHEATVCYVEGHCHAWHE